MSGARPGFRINEVWLYTSIGDDDEEGVLSAEVIIEGRRVQMPLVGTDPIRRDQIRELAVSIGRRARRTVRCLHFPIAPTVEILRVEPPAPKPVEPEAVRCACGEVLDGGTRLGIDDPSRNHRMQPIPGALVVCTYCTKISRFSETNELVVLGEADFAALPEHDRNELRELQRSVGAARAAFDRMS